MWGCLGSVYSSMRRCYHNNDNNNIKSGFKLILRDILITIVGSNLEPVEWIVS